MDVSKMPTMDSVARFKAAMESDKGALGPFMISTDPAFVEAAGYAGYDFVLLDMEHGTTTHQTLPNLIRAANVAGVCPVVRVPRGTDIWIDQALDVGAGAVMVPQIDTAEQARAAVAAAILVYLWYIQMARREFGGLTGDLAGWFLQVCELGCLAAMVLAREIAEVLI